MTRLPHVTNGPRSDSWARRLSAAAAVVALAVAAGCNDDPSAQEQVCDARSDLRDALDDVSEDVQAANLGDAQEALGEVGDAYDELTAALEDLAQEEREALAPEVEALQSDIQSLRDVQSLDQLRAGLDAVMSQAQVIYDDITDTLSCD
jgi:hypothetical protein